jgi:hypothetical protein
MRNLCTVLISEFGMKRPFRRPRCRTEDNIKTNIKEIWPDGVDCIDLALNTAQRWAHVNTVNTPLRLT